MPVWASVGLAAVAGLASFAIFGAGSFALTQRLDPTMATLERNRYLAGGVATALGLAVGLMASPMIGAGLAAGGLVALVGTDAYLALGKVLDKKPDAPPAAASKASFKGLYDGGQQRVNGLYQGGAQRIQGLGGLYVAGQQRIGDVWGPSYQ